MIPVHQLLQEITAFLFTQESRRLENWIKRLVKQNALAYANPDIQAFIYDGAVYKPADLKLPNQALKRRGLHPSLTDEMAAYKLDAKVLDDDRSFISQALKRLLDPCQSFQDVRDALPNCLADALSCTQGLRRQADEAFTIRDDERAMRQYRKILPRIELYAATRMIY